MTRLRIAIGSHPTSELQRQHAEALASGIRAHGDEALIVDRADPPAGIDAWAAWGWRRCEKYRHRAPALLCMERGYIGDRFKWTSLGWGGLNGHADFCVPDNPPGDRFDRNFCQHWRPWKPAGSYVLIMGQVPGDASLRGRDLRPWYVETARAAATAYGLPVYLRPHPAALRRGLWRQVTSVQEMGGPLDHALSMAHVVITWNSNSATDAVLAGVPAVTLDPGAVAWPVSGHEIGERIMPDERLAWARRMAWCQWTIDEIADGTAWAQLRTRLMDRH